MILQDRFKGENKLPPFAKPVSVPYLAHPFLIPHVTCETLPILTFSHDRQVYPLGGLNKRIGLNRAMYTENRDYVGPVFLSNLNGISTRTLFFPTVETVSSVEGWIVFI